MDGPGWPVYFATEAITGRTLTVAKGAPFPVQTGPFLRGLAKTLGVLDWHTRGLADLPFVRIVRVNDRFAAHRIVINGTPLATVLAGLEAEQRGEAMPVEIPLEQPVEKPKRRRRRSSTATG